jgi:hypothetical protein
MKKLFLGLFLIFGLTIGLLNVIVSAEGETTSHTLTINYSVPDQTVDPFIIPGNIYGNWLQLMRQVGKVLNLLVL